MNVHDFKLQNTMAKLILGIAGEMGSGKGSITKHVAEKYTAGSHKFSTILRDILDRVYIEQSRENIALLSMVLRKNFGEDVLSKSMANDVLNDTHEIVVIDGIRRIEDFEYLRTQSTFKLLYVEADMQTCYERLVHRGENEGDKEKTFEEFQKDHERNADVTIKELRSYADNIINNDGTFPELYVKIDEIIKQYVD